MTGHEGDGRSYESIDMADLQRLAEIARTDRENLFARKPRYAVLGERLLCVALCQGAALHYVDGHNGVKDFDVWTFYASHPEITYPWRRRVAHDFGNPKFGKSPDEPRYVGRHVDLLGRSLKAEVNTDPMIALCGYLSECRTKTARHLAQKAVVLLEPASLLGTIAWPIR